MIEGKPKLKWRLDIYISTEEHKLLQDYCTKSCRRKSDVIREMIRRLKRRLDDM